MMRYCAVGRRATALIWIKLPRVGRRFEVSVECLIPKSFAAGQRQRRGPVDLDQYLLSGICTTCRAGSKPGACHG